MVVAERDGDQVTDRARAAVGDRLPVGRITGAAPFVRKRRQGLRPVQWLLQRRFQPFGGAAQLVQALEHGRAHILGLLQRRVQPTDLLAQLRQVMVHTVQDLVVA